MKQQTMSLLAFAALMFLLPRPAFAQFSEVMVGTLSETQSNNAENFSNFLSDSLGGSMSDEQLEQLSAESLIQASQREAEEEEGAPVMPQRRLDASGILAEHERTQRMLAEQTGELDKYSRRENEPPLPLAALQSLPKENLSAPGEGLPFDIRKDAIREAAISYGARGGLAWRTYEIGRELEQRSRYMDRVFNFGQLLVPAPSGLMIEPPIISESINAMLIDTGGQQAAVSDRIYNIINNAKIVSAPRTWRTYLERSWPSVEPPPDILRPQNDEERRLWIELVNKGWQEGIEQADDIFREDLNALLADFRGMVRYRMLLAQGMVSAPYALQVDRGVTGGGDEMRIGDRAVKITGVPQLISGADSWRPASR